MSIIKSRHSVIHAQHAPKRRVDSNHKGQWLDFAWDYSAGKEIISGDLFISVDRVKENALAIGVLFDEELFRVVVHGVLHLLGYSDKEREKKHLMQQKEDHYLTMRPV